MTYQLTDYSPATQRAIVAEAEDDLRRMLPWTHGRTVAEIVAETLRQSWEADCLRDQRLARADMAAQDARNGVVRGWIAPDCAA